MSYGQSVIEIRKYHLPNGTSPFERWFNGIKDKHIKSQIQNRLDRLESGLKGDYKSIGEGVFELRIFEGKGYRIYFANKNNVIIILLCGGDKSTQQKDIKLAKEYWKEDRRQS
jgi:putative addiction module killer protein